MPASSGRGQCTETDVGGRVNSIGRPCFCLFENMDVIAGFVHYDNGNVGSDTLTTRTTSDSENSGDDQLALASIVVFRSCFCNAVNISCWRSCLDTANVRVIKTPACCSQQYITCTSFNHPAHALLFGLVLNAITSEWVSEYGLS